MRRFIVAGLIAASVALVPSLASAAPESQRHGRGWHGHGHRGTTVVVAAAYPVVAPLVAPVVVPVWAPFSCWSYWWGVRAC